MTKKHTSRQHYIPRFYLKGFTRSRNICHFIFRENISTSPVIRESSINNLCVINDLYEVKFNSAQQSNCFLMRNKIENNLSHLENYLSANLEAGKNLLHGKEGVLVPSNDLVKYVASIEILTLNIVTRSPEWIKGNNSMASSILDALLEKETTKDKEESRESLNFARANMELLTNMISMFFPLGNTPIAQGIEVLKRMDITFLKASICSSFITSSMPIVVEWKSEEDTPRFIYFPINSNLAIIFSRCSDLKSISCGVLNVGLEKVLLLNKALLRENKAWNIAIARHRDVLRRAVLDVVSIY